MRNPLLLLALSLCLCGCPQETSSSSDTEDDSSDSKKSKKKKSKSDKKKKKKKEEAAKENPKDAAYLSVEQIGIVRINPNGEAKLLHENKYGVKEFEVTKEGTVWATGIAGTYRIVGDKAEEVDKDGGDHVAAITDSDVWVTKISEIAHYDGKSWSSEPDSVVGAGVLYDITVDKEGTALILKSDAIYEKKKGGSWTQLDLGSVVPKKPYFRRFEEGPNGEVYASGSRGLIVRKAGKWEKVAVNVGYDSVEVFSFGKDGSMAGCLGLDRLLLAPGGGKGRKATKLPFKATSIRTLDIDGQGRVWIPTDHGLAVLAPDMKELLIQWEPGTQPGVSAEVEAILVTGDGPKLTEKAKAVTGTVTGKIVQDGSPVANASVEMCGSASTYIKKSPCEDSAWHAEGKTDASGKFTFKDVPVWSYQFAAQPDGGKWSVFLGGDCCSTMKPGGTADAGEFSIKSKK